MALYREKVAPLTGVRTTLMNEVIYAMRLIKMYAWEKPFIQRILNVRKKELVQIRRAAMMQSVMTSLSPSVTIVAAVVTFFSLT